MINNKLHLEASKFSCLWGVGTELKTKYLHFGSAWRVARDVGTGVKDDRYSNEAVRRGITLAP